MGLTRPNRLADGAATPPPNARSSASATGWSGTRSATVGSPPVTSSGTRSVRGSTRVSGPGQNVAASARASGVTVGRPVGELVDRRQVHDHGMVGGPALHRVEPPERVGRRRVGAEAVDGLGREGDEAAAAQHLRGACDLGGSRLGHADGYQ